MLLITGPTRSGTSLLARFLVRCGVRLDAGQWYVQVNAGHEHPAAVGAATLAHQAGRVVPEAVGRLRGLGVVAVKDPRPVWLRCPAVLDTYREAFGGELRVVLTDRDPYAVADSRLASPEYFRDGRTREDIAAWSRDAAAEARAYLAGVPGLLAGELLYPDFVGDFAAVYDAVNVAGVAGVLPPRCECERVWADLADASLAHHGGGSGG